MELFEDVMREYQNNSLRSRPQSNKSKFTCFPFSVSRMTNRIVHHLFRRNKRRSFKTNKQYNQLTTNMDSYQYTPSNNELQQLLYT
ncbi:unnamed protein product [Rotaria sordida]|uniref:Uncharacterized protein n=1 Tax=Rotaria sordida TaxID=392033 RepID=A0A814GHM8_9BILA|nr:unnamed protein product [Rotaria sordida]CAF0995869.1 unnamed protein product [Rotaria sordida]CAF0996612.1 unnamed protein product [Rotaria sordida]CAF1068765.1 unnamed protein product [Rotaria sordida]CAF3537497.1 unnamed protein product [Rotaria sordida]